MAGSEEHPGGADGYGAALAMIGAVTPSRFLEGAAQSLERTCRAMVDNLGLAGVAVRLRPHHGTSAVLVAPEGASRRLGEMEFSLGEGPGLSAHGSRRPVLVPDLAGPGGAEWPGFRQTAVAEGVAAVFAYPLHVGAVRFGTLELFAVRAGILNARRTSLVGTFAEIMTGILLDGGLTLPDGALSPGLTRVFDHRAEVAQAQGMVMVDLGTTLGEAMARLRAHAFSEGIPLIELARRVIGGYALPVDRDA